MLTMCRRMLIIVCALLICGGCASKQPVEIDQSIEGRSKMAVSKILFSEDQGKGCLKLSKMKGWDIVVDAEAIPSEKYAAEEFQRLFAEATGIQLPINNGDSEAANHVRIGEGAAVDASA